MDLPDLTHRELIGLLTVEMASVCDQTDIDIDETTVTFNDQASGEETEVTVAELLDEGARRAGITTRVVTEGGPMQ